MDTIQNPEMKKVFLNLADGTTGHYFEYRPGQAHQYQRVLVYIHGLISDEKWFLIPDNLPDRTAILFLPRQPREHVGRFTQWTENYQCCLDHFKQSVQAKSYHLLAQCFGSQLGMHWATCNPEAFDTLTIVSPPWSMRCEFTIGTKIRIFLGQKKALQKTLLKPEHYGRLASLIRFINENASTTFDFSNAFWIESNRLRKWLKHNMVCYPVPTHCMYVSEDDVIQPIDPTIPGDPNELPSRTSFLYGFHFSERMPNRALFWQRAFEFMTANEKALAITGSIHKVFVTGASGFLGSHLVKNLVGRGYQVVAFVRDISKTQAMFAPIESGIEYCQGTLDDLDALENGLEGCDAVIHTAGQISDWIDYKTVRGVNVQGTKQLLVAAHAKGIKQFIHTSSLGIFGDTDQNNIDENNPYVLSSDHYSNSKIYAEIFVRRYCQENQIAYTVIRPGCIYGEGDNHILPRIIRTLEAGKAKYIGSTENIVNTVYIGNIVELIMATLGNTAAVGQAYNMSDPQKTTIRELFDTICDELNIARPVAVAPKQPTLWTVALIEILAKAVKLKNPPPLTRKKITFLARSRSVNAHKAYQLIGYEPFSFQEGIRRTLNHIRNTGTVSPERTPAALPRFAASS